MIDATLGIIEEAIGPAAFLTRRDGVYAVHQAGAAFRALFGESDLAARPGCNGVFDRGFAGADPQAGPSAAGPEPLRPTGGGRMPERAVTIPIPVLGRAVGAIVALSDAPPGTLGAAIPDCRVLATAIGEKLLAIIKRKKTG